MAEFKYFSGHSAKVQHEIGAIKDRTWLFQSYRDYMYTRLLAMFSYKNLPDDLPQEILEYYLLSNGSCFITKVDEKIYAFLGSFGGEPDVYYRPELYVVANPALNLSEQYNWKTDGVLMRNDRLWIGLENLVTRYAALMAENLLTIRTADIFLRIVALLSAPDDATRLSAIQYIKDIEDGKLSVVGESPFFEGIRLQSPPSNNGSYLTQFIELHQYFKGSFYNEIGLNANFNMKREAIGKGEASLSQDSLLPLCDTMLSCRKEDVSKINEMYGTNIEVEFSSAWRSNQIEAVLELNKLKAESSQLGGEYNYANNISNNEGDIETEKSAESCIERSESEEVDTVGSSDTISSGEENDTETAGENEEGIQHDDESSNNMQNSSENDEETKDENDEQKVVEVSVDIKMEEGDVDDSIKEDSDID